MLESLKLRLLEFDLSAGSFELLLEVFSFSLGSAFLNSLGSAFDEVLGFLQAEAGDFTNSLNNGDLVRADFRQNDVEFGLLFSSRGSSATSSRSNCNSGSSSGNTELFFHHLDEFADFENGLGRDRVEDFFIGQGHF